MSDKNRQPVTGRDFPDDNALAQPLWRYLTLEKFLSILELEALWLSRLGALQDRFEGAFPNVVRSRLIDETKKWDRLFPDRIDMLRGMTDRTVEDRRGVLAVNCWFADENDSLPMWHEYTNKGTGVAIKTTVRRLRDSLFASLRGDYRDFTRIARVEYIDFESHDMDLYPASQGDEIARLKHSKFRHEKEVRIITFNHVHRGCLNPDGTPATVEQHNGIHSFDPYRKGFYLKCDLHTLIESIYVSPLASPSFGDLIKRLVRRYPTRVPVRLAGVQF